MLQNMHTDHEAPKEMSSPQRNHVFSSEENDIQAIKLAKLKSEILSDKHQELKNPHSGLKSARHGELV